jgi:hypothetical protein
MKDTVGTFNLNNLFFRFNFAGAIEEIQTGKPTCGLTIRYEFSGPKKITTFERFLGNWSNPKKQITLQVCISRKPIKQ